MKRLLATVVLALGLAASPATAVNDPFAPGDECSASDTAIGHPAFVNERSEPASPPFSLNNPGQSTGAKGTENSQALEHCKNAEG